MTENGFLQTLIYFVVHAVDFQNRYLLHYVAPYGLNPKNIFFFTLKHFAKHHHIWYAFTLELSASFYELVIFSVEKFHAVSALCSFCIWCFYYFYHTIYCPGQVVQALQSSSSKLSGVDFSSVYVCAGQSFVYPAACVSCTVYPVHSTQAAVFLAASG